MRAAKFYAIAQFELPAVLLLIVAIFGRRLPRWAVPAGGAGSIRVLGMAKNSIRFAAQYQPVHPL